MPGKNPTIKSLKIGDVLTFGAYSAKGCGDQPVPITWIKASTNCDFVAEYVLDHLVLDAGEVWEPGYLPFSVPQHLTWRYDGSSGDPNYLVSNIFQFLNSAEDGGRWFHPLHDRDAAPQSPLFHRYGYNNHAGFLRYFTETEINAMVNRHISCPLGEVDGLVHLMSVEDVYGDNKLPLFRKRRGIRARPSADLCATWKTMILPGRYMTYALRSLYGSEWYGVASVGTDAYNHAIWPANSSGIRPIIRLNPDAKIALGLGDVWEVVARRRRTFNGGAAITDSALSLLGLV